VKLRFEPRCIGFEATNEAGGLRMTTKSVKRDDDMARRGEALWKDLQWVHQLVHKPVGFTDMPRWRFAFWPSRQSASAKRAAEKAEAQQAAALDLLSEGIAFRRYGATMSLQDNLNLLNGQH
jgi:hypothetical protein